MWRWAISLSLLIISGHLGSATAGVIGGLNAPSEAELSAKIESLYMMLVANGSVPVVKYIVQPGDVIEQVLRDRGAVQGPYFPRIVDALTCDLNPNICHRELTLDGDTTKGQIVVVDNPLQLKVTVGNWSSLRPGQEIYIPHVSIEERLTSFSFEKPASLDFKQLVDASPACGSELLPEYECRSYLRWLNYSDPDALEAGRAATIQLPTLDYSVAVPSDCNDLCAVFQKPVGVDQLVGRFTVEPYTVFSDDPSKVQQDPDVKPRTWSNVLVPDFVQQDGKGLPDNIVERLGIGGKLVDVNKWEKFEPASLFGDFHPSQDAELKSVRFPVAKTEELRARILQGGSMPSVMIVDSFFDAKHCDLPQDFVVYDCSSAVDRDAKVCPIVSGDFHYQGSASGQATASMSASLTHPTGISVPPAREKCGDAGRFSLETPQQTEAFIRERHGTHLAGIIASRWDGFGAGGINPMAKIIGVQVDMDNLTDEGYGSWLLRVIGRIMFEQQVHVVNLSLGYLPKQPTMATSDQERHEWLSELIENHGTGVLFVAAAGNTKETDGCFLTPACLGLTQDNVVTVVALDTDGGAVLSGSNSNSGFALGADGEGILGTMPLNKYGDMSGSSQSAAIVSGAVSLALALGERWTPRGTRERLIACSDVSRDLMGAMVGGKLDIECFLDGGRDRTVDEDGDVKSAKLVRVDRGGQASGELEFFNNGTSRTEPIPIADILGFQRVENDPADIVLFLQPESNPDAKVVRLEGSIPQDQELVFREADGPRSKLKVDEVVKFTRRAI